MQKKVALDFIESDISKGVELLHYLESLLEDKSISIEDVRRVLLEYNEDNYQLDYYKLQHIWDIAVDRASDDVVKKVAIDIMSHGKNTCQWPGCKCKAVEIYTTDGRRVKDMTEAELYKYELEQQDRNGDG